MSAEREEAKQRFAAFAAQQTNDLPLDTGSLLVNEVIEPTADVPYVWRALEGIATSLRDRISAGDSPLSSLNLLSEHLFDHIGFRGAEKDYYDPRNSLLCEVVQRRVGIPISLSIVYMEVGRRLSIPLVGVGMPAHFLVRHADEPKLFVDTFHGGVLLTEAECAALLRNASPDSRWDKRFLDPIDNRAILARVLRNLTGIRVQRDDVPRAEVTLDLLVMLQPDQPAHRRDRGLMRYKLGAIDQALADLEAYLDSNPSAPDTARIGQLATYLKGQRA
ncbi:MAG: tetratricopeptide repeat protein [SAR202 cluster bacterium]|nr:tetratricopeptide repeat protein [SAR202 cluster bacterium]